MDTEEVNETLADYLVVLVRILDVKEEHFVRFVDGITDKNLQKAFKAIIQILYWI